MQSWNWASNGFSNRVSVKRENPCPSRRSTTQVPGRNRRPWKYSSSRMRLSMSSGFIGVRLLIHPIRHHEVRVGRQSDVEQAVEAFGVGWPLQAFERGVDRQVGNARLASAAAVAFQAVRHLGREIVADQDCAE